MKWPIVNMLKGTGGGFEITRVVGAAGGGVYVLGAQAFVAWNMALGREFDITAYCIAFPGGLAAVLTAIAGSAGWKDQKVALARATIAQTETVVAANVVASAKADSADAVNVANAEKV